MAVSPRDLFREGVFARDRHACVACAKAAVDAHHLLERRLFPDGGYLLDNGVSLCAGCHLEAEATTISPGHLRERAGIARVVLPPGLDPAHRHDKWGNPVCSDGTRLSGPLAREEAVRRALGRAGLLHLIRAWPAPATPAGAAAPARGQVVHAHSGARTFIHPDGAHDERLAILTLEGLDPTLRDLVGELPPRWSAVVGASGGARPFLEELWADDQLLTAGEIGEWAALLGIPVAPPAGEVLLARPPGRVRRADYPRACARLRP